MNLDSAFSRRKLIVVLGMWALLMGIAATAAAQSASPVTRIEEDWEMDVVFAKDELGAPQIVTLMSPDSSTSSYFTFEINSTTLPEPEDGGLQVHAWVGDESYDSKTPPTDDTLDRSREIITWTQVMEVQDGMLVFSVENFRSRSLGDFQNDSQLEVSMPTSMEDLSTYHYEHSVDEAGVPYAMNRVNSMTLRRVRLYSGGSELSSSQVDADALSQ
jgi:hypothetical protein